MSAARGVPVPLTSAAELIAQARAVVAEEHGWGAVELAERGGRLMHWVEILCIELEDTTDPKGKGDRAVARLEAMLERFAAETAKLGELQEQLGASGVAP